MAIRDAPGDLEPGVAEDPAPEGGATSAELATPMLRARRWVLDRSEDPVFWVMLAMCVVWAATFFALGRLRHDKFGTFGFDLGIYDQGIWLASQGLDPFVTIRGIDLFGHHMNVALLLFAPFYRLGAGPEFLLFVQVTAQALGAVAVYLLARDLIGRRWVGVALAAVLLLNPTYQWLTWEFFHPDALAIAPLLFAYWAARARRWGIFAFAGVLALACKEDVALALIVIGLLVVLRGDRVIGGAIAMLAAAWFLAATRILIPAFNGIGPFYDNFFGELGDSPTEVVRNAVAHPIDTLDLVTEPDRMSYYGRILAPFGFLPVVGLHVFAVGLPMLGVNALTEFPHTRNFKFHYSSIVIAAGMVAAVEVIAWFKRNPKVVWTLTAGLLVCALGTTHLWGPSPLGRDYDSGIWPLEGEHRAAEFTQAMEMVPADASLSAIYNLAPHMTHRREIYEFPVPWRNINWGVEGENLPDPATVEWIAVDRRRLGEEDQALLDGLLVGEFALRMDVEDVVVAERVAQPNP